MSSSKVQQQSEELKADSIHERALMVLTALAQFGKPVTAQELIRVTQLAKSSLYRQLAVLKKWGFVFEANGLYAPGVVSLQLAFGFNEASLLSQYGKDDMYELSHQAMESVAMTVAMHNKAICIEMEEGTQALRCSFEKGRSVPLQQGATAKCLLAHLPEVERENILKNIATDGVNLLEKRKMLQDIREKGYAWSDSEVDLGVWGVSFPLFARNHRLLGALTLMAPSQRAVGKQEHLIQMTSVAAARINYKLQNN